MVVDADVIRDGVATLDMNAHDGVTWGDYGTWDHDTQQIWGPTLYIPDSGIRLFIEAGAIDLTSSATVTADGDKTQRASITGAMSATVTADGDKIHSTGVADLEAFNTVVTAGTTSTDTSATLSGEFSLSSSAIFQVSGVSSQSAQFDLQASAGVIKQGISLEASSGTLTADGDVIRNAVADLQAFNTQLTTSTKIKQIGATLTTTATLSADGFAEFKGTTNIASEFTTTCNAGVLLRSSVDMNAFNTVLSALTIYIIDPYRVYSVDSESRTLVIEQEPRKFAVKPENRLNNIEQETRGFTVKSESRILKPQTLTLVEQINPLDRREG
jgi:hypothetical protein